MRKRATLKDISKALNISITTVSRALNNKDDISQSTKEAVLEVAKMLNYKPNALAVSLRKKSADNLVGVILPSVNHYFFSTVLNGIMTGANQKNYLVVIGETGHDTEKEMEIIRQFSEHFVTGILIAPTHHPESIENIKELTQRNIPYVLIERTYDSLDGSYVQYDDFHGGLSATEHLIFQGHKNIAIIKGPESCVISEQRYKGYCEALNRHNLPINEELIRPSLSASQEDGIELAKNIFESASVRPDAIFTITDNLASGCFKYLLTHGIKIPDEVAVVGYSNSRLSRLLSPQLSTIEQNGKEIGLEALGFLVDQVLNPNKISQKTFSANLIIRESSRKRLLIS